MTSPKKNFIYNILYQVMTLIVPLVIAPYLSRVIGSSGVGIYSYTYSIVHYFMLLTLLGVNNYGNRTIAKVRENKEKLSKTFWNIYYLQLIMGILMITIYLLYIFLFDNKYRLISIIQTLFIVSAIFDINWFFFGLEEFKKTVTRNTIIKFLNAVLIFIIVKEKNDVWKYTLIMSGMTFFSQIVMWGFLKKYVVFKRFEWKEAKKHIKANIVLFVPVIAISLYKIMDKIMLGIISTVSEVGLYENAEKIINVPSTLIAALGNVMLPRMSNLTAKGDKKKISEYMLKSEKFVMFLSFAMTCGLIAVGYKFAPMYFGNEFKKTGILIMMLSITLPFLSFANVLRTQYLIPNEKDKIYIKSVFLGAIINLIMNVIFIPKYKSIGACIGTIFAEFSVMLYQALSIKKDLPINLYFKNSIIFLIKSIVMLTIIYPLNFINMNDLVRLLIQITLGGIIYFVLNFKYICEIIDLKKFLQRKIKSKC